MTRQGGASDSGWKEGTVRKGDPQGESFPSGPASANPGTERVLITFERGWRELTFQIGVIVVLSAVVTVLMLSFVLLVLSHR